MTKEEILKSNEDNYLDGHLYVEPIFSAMEEYAKQEAIQMLVYFQLLANANTDNMSNDELWNEYQKSKLK